MTATEVPDGHVAEVRKVLLKGRIQPQSAAIGSDSRRLLVLAGAGSGKTDVMARGIASDVGVRGAPRDVIVAFTFTERPAEEMQFRVRCYVSTYRLIRLGLGG